MEGANVIAISNWTFKETQVFEDWNKWAKGSLVPMLMSNDATLGIDRWISLQEKSIYVNTISINYFADMQKCIIYGHAIEPTAYLNDLKTTWGGKYERSWDTNYYLIRDFNVAQIAAIDKGDNVDKNTRLKEFPAGDAPVTLLRGLGLSPDKWEKYDNWVNEWGFDVYIPMLLKVPGVTEYSRWWLSNVGYLGLTPRPGVTENPDYPQDLSIIHFENTKAYQNFCRSKELAAFNQIMKNASPGGLNYKWDVAYRLMRRWSR